MLRLLGLASEAILPNLYFAFCREEEEGVCAGAGTNCVDFSFCFIPDIWRSGDNVRRFITFLVG